MQAGMTHELPRPRLAMRLLGFAGATLLATLPETHERVQRGVALLIALGVALRATKGQGAPEVAQTIVQLGADLSSIVTRSTLQAGLEYAGKYRREKRPA